MLSYLCSTRARSRVRRNPHRHRVRTSALATLGGARRDEKAPRAPKNQSAGRRPAGPPSEPPLVPCAARSLLELAVQRVPAEVRIVLHELQALGGVAAVLRARADVKGRQSRVIRVARHPRRAPSASLSLRRAPPGAFRARLTRGGVAFHRALRRRRLRVPRAVRLDRVRDATRRRRDLSLRVRGVAKRARKNQSPVDRVSRSPRDDACVARKPIGTPLYPPGVERGAARERLGDARLTGTRARTF